LGENIKELSEPLDCNNHRFTESMLPELKK